MTTKDQLPFTEEDLKEVDDILFHKYGRRLIVAVSERPR
jgi:hypothetical protein